MHTHSLTHTHTHARTHHTHTHIHTHTHTHTHQGEHTQTHESEYKKLGAWGLAFGVDGSCCAFGIDPRTVRQDRTLLPLAYRVRTCVCVCANLPLTAHPIPPTYCNLTSSNFPPKSVSPRRGEPLPAPICPLPALSLGASALPSSSDSTSISSCPGCLPCRGPVAGAGAVSSAFPVCMDWEVEDVLLVDAQKKRGA
jgi:hypothetical protein